MSELLAVLTDLEPIDPDVGDPPPRLPALERLLARAERDAAPTDWRRYVLDRLGLRVAADELPLGATLAAAAGLPSASGTWLVATPVHLLATLSDLRMHVAGPLALDAAAASDVARAVTAACGDAAFRVHAIGATLVAQFDDALDLRTTDPAPLAGRRIDVQLPGGRDGGRVRRRMTEIQMAMHERGIRDASGGLAVNALWLWGGGRTPLEGRASWPELRSDEAFLRALHALDAGRVDRPGARLVTWRLASLAGRGDAFAAADREWFAPLADDLARGRVRRATLHFAGRAYTLTPAQRWRVWTKSRPWWELSA